MAFPWRSVRALRQLRHPVVAASFVLGCASDPVDGGKDGTEGGASGDPPNGDEGTAFEFDVPVGERVFVSLSTPGVVEADRGGTDWDLAFEGYGIYTNGGLSGPGKGASFGPLSAPTFLSDTPPNEVPLARDEAGGVFLRWYAYDEHVLHSRFHVYAFKDGDRYYKFQILSYYGQRFGAPVSALYTVRYAEVLPEGPGATRVEVDIDATPTDPSQPAECLEFENGTRLALSAGASLTSDGWHVCFRREAISVNGGTIGPRGVEAVDLDAALTDVEREIDIQEFTPESEQARFDVVDRARLEDPELVYRPDGVASAFAGRWLLPNADPPAPKNSVWYVVGAGGTHYLLTFDGFQGATAESPGRIAARVKTVR
jgi:hypothetical protein